MKKEKKLILIISLVYTLSLISLLSAAAEITILKSQYQPMETLQGEISANFIDSITQDNIFLYKEGTPRPIPAINGVIYFNDLYYFYIVLPNQEGNFTIEVASDYSESGSIKNTLNKSFAIKRTNESALSINPGFIHEKDSFLITIKSLYNPQNIEASLETTQEKKNIYLLEDSETTLDFSLKQATSQKINLKINNYNIPVFVINPAKPLVGNHTECINYTCVVVNGTGDNLCEEIGKYCNYSLEHTECINNECVLVAGQGTNACILNQTCTSFSQLRFSKNSLYGALAPGTNFMIPVALQNIASSPIKNITLTSDFNAKIIPSTIAILNSSQAFIINITISIDKKQEKNITGNIIASSENTILKLPVFIEVAKNSSQVSTQNLTGVPGYSCQALKGELCMYNETCVGGNQTRSLEGNCCLGKCTPVSSGSSYTWIIGLIIILALIGLGAYFYLKSKKQKFSTPSEILSKRADDFKERINPTIHQPSKEVSKSLGSV
ncbi:MAG: hypothetical protein ACP5OG_03555 [Candidatus Nanoarchaeia archaeon]